MSSHSSHHQSTSTHPYPYQIEDPQQSMSTLASSIVPTKKTFLGRWKSAFRKEAMEALPEQGTLLSSFLTTPTSMREPPAIPPILHDPLLPLTQQTWQGTSYDSAWERSGNQEHQFQGNLPALVLRVHQPTPHSGSTFSGITSTFHTPPSSPGEVIRIEYECQTHDTWQLYTGTSLYKSPSNFPPCQSQPGSPHQSSKQRVQSRVASIHPDHPDDDVNLKTHPPGTPSPSQIRRPETEEQQSMSASSRSEGLMRRQEESVHRKPSTTLAATPAPRYSPPQSMSMAIHGEAPTLPQPQLPRKLPTPPHTATPMNLSWALYLLSTGKLTDIPETLFRVPLLDLFNHFMKELVENPDWAVTPAGMDYTHYGYSYILKEEARHFACVTFNMIHQEQMVKVPAHYR
ncbi:hypothetical protein ARMGADRAFT_1085833 [Armillaria gallica]|uniref:Uncharacterized protein n=1 Tax=Armillaria gallica TaxID=47427 RepID=A0A2H3DFQ0_ARMGA|nr:hypothetical protein ARMGADRAFT_1085833 [Armillaria gallica]